ncbi:mycofactocin precursor MftA [Natrialbaceae archaeon GCM10025810]
MSQTASEDGTVDGDGDEEPDIEEDLISEELRIDGICGVY